MKKLFYTLLIVSAPLYAQNVVYKCVDSSGNTSYLNVGSKNAHCEKTDLADPTKGSSMMIRNEDGGNIKTASYTKSVSTAIGNIPVIKSDEQKKKDEGRNSILSRELQDEQEQLGNIRKMLQNVADSKDTEQIGKLREMEDRHVKNINSLKRELGIKENIAIKQVFDSIAEKKMDTGIQPVVAKQ